MTANYLIQEGIIEIKGGVVKILRGAGMWAVIVGLLFIGLIIIF